MSWILQRLMRLRLSHECEMPTPFSQMIILLQCVTLEVVAMAGLCHFSSHVVVRVDLACKCLVNPSIFKQSVSLRLSTGWLLPHHRIRYL
ncbi:hypothetical protein M408DRAFT_170032 [Serendipita vermifera MAFF 305830]|uniref:Uncharacterized protein n=1 Tax=Serendipita vermifera MAFF 305830 TaxID=933852 RepID=A0A0C3B5H5_SERVB|nr:hypothetical protein M408DRAFT_170032 [Serendipita vermifera MAFF 305830]